MISPTTLTTLKKMVSLHEGRFSHAYQDIKNITTIGVGRNISTSGPGLRESEIDFMLANDLNFFSEALSKTYPWFDGLSDARKCAIIDFAFIGMRRLSEFKMMLLALSEGKFDDAANELLNSEYAKEVGNRAKTLAKIIRTNELIF